MASLPEGVKVEVRLFISKEGFIVGGEGLIEILEAVREHGSLSLAAKSLGMTYKKVWSRITEAERTLGVRLVERQRGKGRFEANESRPGAGKTVQGSGVKAETLPHSLNITCQGIIHSGSLPREMSA